MVLQLVLWGFTEDFRDESYAAVEAFESQHTWAVDDLHRHTHTHTHTHIHIHFSSNDNQTGRMPSYLVSVSETVDLCDKSMGTLEHI